MKLINKLLTYLPWVIAILATFLIVVNVPRLDGSHDLPVVGGALVSLVCCAGLGVWCLMGRCDA